MIKIPPSTPVILSASLRLRVNAAKDLIAHALPKNLQVDEVVRIGAGSVTAVSVVHDAHNIKRESEGGLSA